MNRLNMNDPDVQSAFAELLEHGRTMQGTNFALLMSEEGDGGTILKTYARPSQPCQGGEMRKYYKRRPMNEQGYQDSQKQPVILHENCTRKDDPSPGDLKMPFPPGRPEAVAVRIETYHSPGTYSNEDFNAYVDAVYGPDSMYTKSLGGAEAILKLSRDDGRYQTIVFTDTEVDSTVLVNSLQFFRTGSNPSRLKALKEIGFTTQEALIVCYMTGFTDFSQPQIIIDNPYAYYFSTVASLRRLFDGTPNDLTGGTFRDGFDYNRPNIQDLFKAGPDENGLIFQNVFNQKYLEKYKKKAYDTTGYDYVTNLTREQFYETTKEIFDEYLQTSLKEAA
jgi:hypothetical protein